VQRGEVPRLSRRAALAGGGAAVAAALLPPGAAAHDHKRHARRKVADLTHVFRAGFPVYVGAEPTRVRRSTRFPSTASTGSRTSPTSARSRRAARL